MRILIENGTYSLRNLGDVAMFQVAMNRLRAHYPDAVLHVITVDPELLERYCPGAVPVSLESRKAWFKGLLASRSRALLGSRTVGALNELEGKLRVRHPGLRSTLLGVKGAVTGASVWKERTLARLLLQTDGLLISGGGHFADCFEEDTLTMLELVETVARLGKWTVMFGQGISSLNSPRNRIAAQRAFPLVNFISLREKLVGPGVLKSIGLDTARIPVTGDDAVELAYDARSEILGDGLGINLRLAPYADTSESSPRILAEVLKSLPPPIGQKLVPLPISLHDGEDIASIRQVLSEVGVGPEIGFAPESIRTPADVVQRASRCRVVVTGSYHSAVFALGQGIPTVALAQSSYYKEKFLGLADQFGVGCEVLSMKEEGFFQHCRLAIDTLWKRSSHLRGPLLEAAKRQVLQSRATHDAFWTSLGRKVRPKKVATASSN